MAFAIRASSFRQNVTSSAGAMKIMPVMPSSGEWASKLVGRRLNLPNAADNLAAGIAIIAALSLMSPSTQIAIPS